MFDTWSSWRLFAAVCVCVLRSLFGSGRSVIGLQFGWVQKVSAEFDLNLPGEGRQLAEIPGGGSFYNGIGRRCKSRVVGGGGQLATIPERNYVEGRRRRRATLRLDCDTGRRRRRWKEELEFQQSRASRWASSGANHPAGAGSRLERRLFDCARGPVGAPVACRRAGWKLEVASRESQVESRQLQLGDDWRVSIL